MENSHCITSSRAALSLVNHFSSVTLITLAIGKLRCKRLNDLLPVREPCSHFFQKEESTCSAHCQPPSSVLESPNWHVLTTSQYGRSYMTQTFWLKTHKKHYNKEVSGRFHLCWITDNILLATILSGKLHPDQSIMITEPLLIILINKVMVCLA